MSARPTLPRRPRSQADVRAMIRRAGFDPREPDASEKAMVEFWRQDRHLESLTLLAHAMHDDRTRTQTQAWHYRIGLLITTEHLLESIPVKQAVDRVNAIIDFNCLPQRGRIH